MLWNLMMKSHVECGLVDLALLLYKKMRELGVSHDCFTFPIVNKVVMLLGGEVSQFDGYVIKNDLLYDASVQNSILRMYAKLGTINEVEDFFSELDRRDGKVAPGVETLTLVISALTKHGILSQGESLHCLAIKRGLCDHVLQTSLLDLYAKCGELGISDRLFREIPHRNSITWGAMMFGFIQNGWFSEAVGLFREMQALGPEPTAEILRSLVDAFANLGALKLGKQIHGYIIRKSLYEDEESYTHLETSIINMYIRSGSLSAARVCFDRMLVKDIVTWTSMIEGYGSHGLGFEALKLFDLMIREGIRPNSATFISLLSACSHSGLATEGFGVLFFQDVEFTVSDRDVGEHAAQRLLELEPDNARYHTLLSNTQASVGQWDEVEVTRRVMSEMDLKKMPGWSCQDAIGIDLNLLIS
ncbi:hypothetical protein ACFX1W_034083 [Malus domestica]